MTEDVFGIIGTVQGGAFRVDEVVAEGGFAVVYRAYHSAFRSNVALKCLKIPRALSESEQKEFLERFREEAELLFRLSSAIPSVVRPLHVGTLSKTGRFVPFIALEWLEGRTLDSLISARATEGQPPLDPVAAMKILTPVADALARAHQFPGPNGPVSVIHRDLKPENIFVANMHGRELTKVLDFGIAKVKSTASQMAGRQSVGESQMTAFTPAYGAPEQWNPKQYGQTGPWTDVWGLAITFVEAVSGHAPIDGDLAAMMVAAVDTNRRPTPRNQGVKVSDDVEAVMAQALAVDPLERFHDVSAFWNALGAALGSPAALRGSQSLAPPIAGAGLGSARTAFAPKSAAVLPAGDVPDLVVSSPPRALRSAPVEPRPPPPQPTSGLRAAAIDPSSFYGGSTFDALDDSQPRFRRSPELSLDLNRGGSFETPRRTGTIATERIEPKKLELSGPFKLLGAAVGLMALDYTYAAFTGEVLHLGPARMLWLAGPLAGIGTVLLLLRLLAATE